MTPATEPMTAPVEARRPSLTAGVLELLNVLMRGARPAVLRLESRSLHGFSRTSLHVRVEPMLRFLPSSVLDVLEERQAVGLTVSPATWDRGTPPAARDLGVLCAVFSFERKLVGSRLALDAEQVAAARTKLAAFACPPTAVVDAHTKVMGLWSLTRPLELDRGDLERASALQLALARHLGADEAVAADPLAVRIPVPGTAQRNAGNDPVPVVQFQSIDSSRQYALAELEAAPARPRATRKGTGA